MLFLQNDMQLCHSSNLSILSKKEQRRMVMARKVECFTFFSIFVLLLLSELIFDAWAVAKPKVAKSKAKIAVVTKKKPPPAKKVTSIVKRVTPKIKIKIINDWYFGPMNNCHKNFTPPKFRVVSCPKGDAVNAFMYMECRTCEHKGPKTVMINCTHRIVRQTKDVVFFCHSDKKELCMGVFSARNVKRSYDEFCKTSAKVNVKAKKAKTKVKTAPKKSGRKRKRDLLHDAPSRDQFNTADEIEHSRQKSRDGKIYESSGLSDENEIKVEHDLRKMSKNHARPLPGIERPQIRQRTTGDDECNDQDDDFEAEDQGSEYYNGRK